MSGSAHRTDPVVDLWQCSCRKRFLDIGNAIAHQRLHGHQIATLEAATTARLQAAGDFRNDPDDSRHGTPHGYNLGCRCVRCRAARRSKLPA
jgi:hypothetical protein